MNATVKALDGDTLVLSIAAAPLARRLSEQRNSDVIAAALRSVLGVAWRVRCEHGTPTEPAPSGPPQRPAAQAPQQPARRPSGSGRPPAPDEPPLPPEPPPDDEEEMLAEAADGSGERGPRRDPEEVAIELLSAQLGARAVDERR
jgi:DNA polymerase-3 subunit gamma/tau